jgi:hypothetical protein
VKTRKVYRILAGKPLGMYHKGRESGERIKLQEVLK